MDHRNAHDQFIWNCSLIPEKTRGSQNIEIKSRILKAKNIQLERFNCFFCCLTRDELQRLRHLALSIDFAAFLVPHRRLNRSAIAAGH